MQINRSAFFDRDILNTKVCSVCYLSHNKFAFEAKLSEAKRPEQSTVLVTLRILDTAPL